MHDMHIQGSIKSVSVDNDYLFLLPKMKEKGQGKRKEEKKIRIW